MNHRCEIPRDFSGRIPRSIFGLIAFSVFTSIHALAISAPGGLLRVIGDPAPERGGDFGFAVAAIGSKIVVASPDWNWPYANGCLYLIDPFSNQVLLRIERPDSEDGFLFGSSIATLGNKIVVSSASGEAGYVHVFDATLRGVTKTPILTIRSPDPEYPQYFGSPLGSSGNNILVGGLDTVYEFDSRLTGIISTPILTLRNPKPGFARLFGYGGSVAGTPANILVGAPGGSPGPDNGNGMGFVFDAATKGNSGTPLFSLGRPRVTVGEYHFGYAISPLGDNILVGAPIYGSPGLAYLFSGTSATETSFTPLLTIESPPIPPSGFGALEFGQVVIPAGDNIVVGAPGSTEAFVFNGLARGTINTPILTLECPNPKWDGFGRAAVSIGDNLVISQGGYYPPDQSYFRAVYVFEGLPDVKSVNDAAIVGSEVIASTGRIGRAYVTSDAPVQVVITVQNMGNTSWTSQEGYGLAIRPSGGPIRPHRLALPEGTVIPPGGTFQFSETIPALRKPYQFRLQARMFQDSKGPFGKPLTIKVKVRNTAP